MSFSIRSLQGHLDDQWSDWFGGLTILTSSVVDQAALYELFKKIRDLDMPLIGQFRSPRPGRMGEVRS